MGRLAHSTLDIRAACARSQVEADERAGPPSAAIVLVCILAPERARCVVRTFHLCLFVDLTTPRHLMCSPQRRRPKLSPLFQMCPLRPSDALRTRTTSSNKQPEKKHGHGGRRPTHERRARQLKKVKRVGDPLGAPARPRGGRGQGGRLDIHPPPIQ
eukprot:scaffold4212_cov122-Isochrysis_galbana.AAC.8